MKENADKARALDTAEIEKQLREAKDQVFRLRFQMSMGQMEGVKKVRSLRKERARMLTVLRERELTGAAKTATATPAAPAKPAKAKTGAKPAAVKTAAAKPAAAVKTRTVKAASGKTAAGKTATGKKG